MTLCHDSLVTYCTNEIEVINVAVIMKMISAKSITWAEYMAKQGVQRSCEFVAWLWLHYFSVTLFLCFLPLYLWVISILFCRGMFSFELIRMDILWFSLFLFIFDCALSYIWFFIIVRYCVASILLPPDFDV